MSDRRVAIDGAHGVDHPRALRDELVDRDRNGGLYSVGEAGGELRRPARPAAADDDRECAACTGLGSAGESASR